MSAIPDPAIVRLMRIDWRSLTVRTLPFMALYAFFLVAEVVTIARMDLLFDVQTLETASRLSVAISGAALLLRLCVVGAALRHVMSRPGDAGTPPVSTRFIVFWCATAVVLATAIGGIEFWMNEMRLIPWESVETMRALWLAGVYAQVILFYLAVRLLIGAVASARIGPRGIVDTWSATALTRSLGLAFALLVLKLFIEGTAVTVASYLPVIAPFWVIPDELSESRYFVAVGTRFAVESLGLVLYVAFFLAAGNFIVGRRKGAA